MANKDEIIVETVTASSAGNTDVTSLFEQHQNKIYGVLAVLLILTVGVYAYVNFYKIPRESEAHEELFQAQFQFERDSFNLALAGSTDPQKPFKGFLSIIADYSGTEAGNLAYYYAGVCLLNTGQYDEAISMLQSYSGGDKLSQAMAYGLLGDAESEKGNMDAALSYYEKAANYSPSEAVSPLFLHKAALLSEHTEKKDKALDYFKRIQAEYPNAAKRLKIERELIRLGQ